MVVTSMDTLMTMGGWMATCGTEVSTCRAL
jgi:hypothetical protein